MKYEYWLARIRGISAKKKRMLREHMNSAESVYYIEETQLEEAGFLNENEKDRIRDAQKEEDPEEEYEKMCGKGIRFIPWSDREYPGRLREMEDMPYALYVKGKLPLETSRTAAVIGARRCTPYGEKYAVDFAAALAGRGVEIISGMARGIDGMGHRGALMAGGRTFAVLGSGVDICYPREHIGLYMDILEQDGGILSEQPPGTPPLPQHFPARNRIISGLSDAVLVMEAGKKSGSLITVDLALEQGKDIYALPGPVNSELSDGCNRLIRQGAGILLSPESLLEEWHLEQKPDVQSCEKCDKNEKVLETTEKLVYSRLGLYPKDVDQLAAETGMNVRELMGLLVSLELKGYAREISKNHYIR
ncbi:DNA-processing protein DprA [Ruminococcus sp. CLA-AA-H200]|uniref:DNA-processing protein DprA n=1 Tax=Ruminococcus turbiniformis TaxID=2881258 RepID=A0ABS8G0D3_9FIRM|nr:DNA-processing protein DprA [Ruminococcus turbiniformis]MCC2254887.1 DNA-processing protein DprA [Ruminococcus turbiniformis]